jgi:predicted nucleic acid-binding protein
MIKPASAVLVDTNILLRLTNPNSDQHAMCRDAMRRIEAVGCRLHFTLQNAAEFWNVSTRPRDRNGFGLSGIETEERLQLIEQNMTLLPDSSNVYATWRRLLRDHGIRGVQVHDARLAAVMMVHRVMQILTLNTADFSRYSEIEAVHPADVANAAGTGNR